MKTKKTKISKTERERLTSGHKVASYTHVNVYRTDDGFAALYKDNKITGDTIGEITNRAAEWDKELVGAEKRA